MLAFAIPLSSTVRFFNGVFLNRVGTAYHLDARPTLDITRFYQLHSLFVPRFATVPKEYRSLQL
jgi:hypothetical protein